MPDDEKLDIYHTLSGPEAEKEAKEIAAEEVTELAGLKQHVDAPKIDGYLMLRSIGNGAYAQVWEAIQLRTRRFVAVKVFHKTGVMHWNLLQREADRMIRLDKHPHIVSLLDADLRGEIPYYVMDLAQEGSLDGHIQTKKNSLLTPKDVYQAATWMQEIAEALQYVHMHEMIHCDLKPANILLDQEGHVRVADFGHSLVLTDSGGALGSLFYMAPEQTMTSEHGQIIQPDVRWDIYALGCTIYTILNGGHPPHENVSHDLEMTPILATRLKIYRKAIETEKVPDLHTTTQGGVDKDLSAIIAKCMSVNPDERYNDMTELLNDLKRRWQGKPVRALAGDRVYWLRKHLHRYKVLIIAVGIILVITLLASFMMIEHQKAHAQDTALSDILRGKEYLDNGDEATASAYFAEANDIYPSLLARGNALIHLPPVPFAISNTGKPIQTMVLSRDGKNLLTTGTSNANLWTPKENNNHSLKNSGKNTVAAFNPEGSKVAVGDARGEIRIYDVNTQKQIAKFTEPDGEITALAFSPNGRKLATACDYGTVHFWNANNGTLYKPTFNPGPGVYYVEFNKDGKYLLTATNEGNAQVWDTENGDSKSETVRLDIKNAPNWYRPDVFFLPDNKFATTGWDGTVRFYERNGGHTSHPISLDGLGAKALLSVSGHQLLTSVLQNKITGLLRIYGLHSHNPSPFKFKTNGRISSMALSADGSRVMAGTVNHTAQVWLTATGKPLSHPLWHGDVVTAAAFSPSGKVLATASKDGLARLWNFEAYANDITQLDWKRSGRKGYEKNQSTRLFSHDGKSLLTYSSKNAYLWNASTGKTQGVLMTAPGSLKTALFGPNDKDLLLFGKSGGEIWDLSSKKGLVLKLDGTPIGADFSADSKKIAIITKEKTLTFWDSSSSMQLGKTINLNDHPAKINLSPDGNLVALITDKNYLRLYSAKGGPAFLKVDKWVKAVIFTDDSQTLVAAVGGLGNIYDSSTGKQLRSFRHSGLNTLLSTPDSKTIISFSPDGTGRLWDAQTADPLGNPMKHESDVSQMVLGPKGNALLVIYKDKTREIWDTHSGETIGGEIPNGSTLKAVTFDKDSRGYKMVDAKGKIIHVSTDWVDPNMDPDRLVKTSEVAGLCRVNGQGFVQPISPDQWASLWKNFKKTLVP